MLIEFKVRNYRSFFEEQSLSFEAQLRKGEEDPGLREPPGAPSPLSAVSALYGPNASGKSNILRAFALLCRVASPRLADRPVTQDYDPFHWDAGPTTPTTLEATFVLDGARYRYGLTFNQERVCEEWLDAWPRGRRQMWFKRTGDTFRHGSHLKSPRKHGLTSDVVAPDQLALPVAARLNQPQIVPLAKWFAAHDFVRVGAGTHPETFTQRPGQLENYLGEYLEYCDQRHGEASPERNMILLLLQVTDSSVRSMEHAMVVEESSMAADRGRQHRIALVHRAQPDAGGLPLWEASNGTRIQAYLAPYVIQSLKHGSTLCIDELDNGLHPLISHRLISLFQDPDLNPRNAQLLFSTHDSWLLAAGRDAPHIGGPGIQDADRLLRRDQVWLTEKADDLRSCLYPLTDIMPRKSEDLQRGYLEGRYGAIPFPHVPHIDLSEA